MLHVSDKVSVKKVSHQQSLLPHDLEVGSKDLLSASSVTNKSLGPLQLRLLVVKLDFLYNVLNTGEPLSTNWLVQSRKEEPKRFGIDWQTDICDGRGIKHHLYCRKQSFIFRVWTSRWFGTRETCVSRIGDAQSKEGLNREVETSCVVVAGPLHCLANDKEMCIESGTRFCLDWSQPV